MKQTKKKMNRILAVLLVAVMVVISLPQTGMQALASESQLQTEDVEEIKESESDELEAESQKTSVIEIPSQETESAITEETAETIITEKSTQESEMVIVEETKSEDVSVIDEAVEENMEEAKTEEIQSEETEEMTESECEESETDLVENNEEVCLESDIDSLSADEEEVGEVTVDFACSITNGGVVYSENGTELTSKTINIGETIKFRVEVNSEYLVDYITITNDESGKVEGVEDENGIVWYTISPEVDTDVYVYIVQKVQFSFWINDNIGCKVYAADGITEISDITTTVGDTSEYSFVVKPDEGYVIKRIRANGYKNVIIKGNYQTGKYTIKPRKQAYIGSETIYIEIEELKNYTATFNYLSNDVDLLVYYKDSSEAILNNNAIEVSNNNQINFKIKPLYGEFVEVYYNTATGGDVTKLSYDEIDDNGYYCYSYFRMFDNYNLTINVFEGCEITFDKTYISLTELEYNIEDGEEYYSEARGIGTSLKVPKDKPFYFYVSNRPSCGKSSISIKNEQELEPFLYDDESYGWIYRIIPTENMHIVANTEPIAIPIVYDADEFDKFDVNYYSDYENNWGIAGTVSEDKKTLYIRRRRGIF